MTLDSIIGLIIVPIIFIWIGVKIYKHEKEHIDPLIEKVKGWFSKKEEEAEVFDSGEYKIKYRGAEY